MDNTFIPDRSNMMSKSKLAQVLNIEQAAEYLQRIGMKLTQWDVPRDIDPRQDGNRQWVNRQAPKEGLRLRAFSQHVVRWLPEGEWKLLILENATSLNQSQLASIWALLFGKSLDVDATDARYFLFSFDDDGDRNDNIDLCIADLISLLLLFCANADIVSSASNSVRYLSLQDGIAILTTDSDDSSAANEVLRHFDNDPNCPPQWALDFIARAQEKNLQ